MGQLKQKECSHQTLNAQLRDCSQVSSSRFTPKPPSVASKGSCSIAGSLKSHRKLKVLSNGQTFSKTSLNNSPSFYSSKGSAKTFNLGLSIGDNVEPISECNLSLRAGDDLVESEETCLPGDLNVVSASAA